MSRNVEIKAYCKDLESAKAKILTLKSLANHTDNDIVVMEQEDVFYNLPADRAGKLKLRKIKVNYFVAKCSLPIRRIIILKKILDP